MSLPVIALGAAVLGGLYYALRPSALPKPGPGAVPGATVLRGTSGTPFISHSPPANIGEPAGPRQDIRVGDTLTVDVKTAGFTIPEIPTGNVLLKVTQVDAPDMQSLQAVSIDPRLSPPRGFTVPRKAVSGIEPG